MIQPDLMSDREEGVCKHLESIDILNLFLI